MSPQSPRRSKPKKPKLSVETLNNRDIFFDSECTTSDLDNFISTIRDQLIRLRQQLPKDEEPRFAQQLETFKNSGQDREEADTDGWSLMPRSTDSEPVYFEDNGSYGNSQIENITKEIRVCKGIAEKAKCLRKRNEAEPGWMKFLQSSIFKEFDDVHDIPNSKVHHPVRRWELQQDLHWNEFPDFDDRSPDEHPLTGPKPDLTYAFPIVDTRDIATPYVFDEKVEDFSLEVLGALRTNEKTSLCSAPTTKLRRWQTNKNLPLGTAGLLCFPWAIVEAKRNKFEKEKKKKLKLKSQDYDAKEEFCYCQAANASAAALRLREDLVNCAKDRPTSRDGLVIFAFTCIGPTVKLWVTFRDMESKIIVMKCIWATSLELTWGAIALRMVMKSMDEWVCDRVIPAIRSWIRMVRESLSPMTPRLLTPGRDRYARTRRAASCEPRVSPTSPSPKTHAAVLRGKSSPESSDRRRHRRSLPNLPRKGSFHGGDFTDEGEDSEGSEGESDTDEGYDRRSMHKHGAEGEEEDSTAKSDTSDEDERVNASTAESDSIYEVPGISYPDGDISYPDLSGWDSVFGKSLSRMSPIEWTKPTFPSVEGYFLT